MRASRSKNRHFGFLFLFLKDRKNEQRSKDAAAKKELIQVEQEKFIMIVRISIYIYLLHTMKSTKVQTLGGNIGIFGLETPLHAYVLGMLSIEPRSRTICIVLSMPVYM